MTEVFTPDGWGQVLRTESAHGRTSYLIKGAGFEGWCDGLQITADFADHPDDVIPNEENETTLPYPSKPQGPGWDGTTSTIEPGIDPHLQMGTASDSLTGEDTSEDPVEADIEGLFEPHSHLAGSRVHRVHFANSDDPILDVSTIPDDSPIGLDNSPINPDHVDTDDLFDGSLPHFERESSYDRLVIEDDLSFLRYAADEDDDKKKHHHEYGSGQSGFPRDNDDDDDDSDDSDSDDSDSDDSSSGDGDSDGDGDGGDGGGSHTAAIALALSTTAVLHFLANMCSCDESIPLHSKSEHRELVAEGKLKDRRRKNKPLGSNPLKGQHGEHDPKTPGEAGYDKAAHAVTDLVTPKRKGIKKRKVEHPIKYADFDTPPAPGTPNGVEAQPRDLAGLHERYLQGQLGYQEPLDLVDHDQDDADAAGNYNHYASTQRHSDGYDKYIGGGEGHFYLIASGGGKLPKGEHYGHYDSYEDAHSAVEAIIARNHSKSSKTAAPAADPNAQPTQIESQIEQLMQFWAVDNNGWWHWTGSQSDLALLNQMQQQMMAVGMPGGPPGQMQAQSAFELESDTPPRWREYLQTIASDRLMALAAWKDVVEKSKRLRSEGAIDVEAFRPDVITAYVQGDHGRYYTTVQRLGSIAPGVGRQLTSTQVSGWSCDCDWGHWAWLRKRSFVGRMCSHAYALFSEMRSLDAKARRTKGQPGRFASVSNKTSWARTPSGGFDWVTTDLALPTATIAKTAAGWNAYVWSDGTSEDYLSLGTFGHSEQARRAIARVVTEHVKLSVEGDVDLVGDGGEGTFDPYEHTGDSNVDPYSETGVPEYELPASQQSGSPGVQDSTTRTGAAATGDDDEGPEEEDTGIEEEDDPDDDESLDEEIAEDEDDSNDGSDDEGDDPESDDGDGGHDEPHKRDDSEDDDEDEGTDNPGDESDDDHIEKESSVVDLQAQFGLSHLAGADYSLADQHRLVSEGENGPGARNKTDLKLTGTHYEASADSGESPEDTLAFLF